MSQDQRWIDRRLQKCVQDAPRRRKELRAELRALREKLNLPVEGSRQSPEEDNDSKH